MWGLVPVKGRFHEFSGDGQITAAPNGFRARRHQGRVAATPKLSKRDEHLRSADFFEAEKFPDISVVVTGAEASSGDTVDLRANLTVKGTTRPCPCTTKVRRYSTTARCGSPPQATSTARTSAWTAT